MTAFFEFVTEKGVITTQEIHIGEKVNEGKTCNSVQCDNDELIYAMKILNIPQIPERVFTFWNNNAEIIYKNWNKPKSQQERLAEVINKISALEEELENLTEAMTWQELVNYPMLEAKAYVRYRRENNCGLGETYKAIKEYKEYIRSLENPST